MVHSTSLSAHTRTPTHLGTLAYQTCAAAIYVPHQSDCSICSIMLFTNLLWAYVRLLRSFIIMHKELVYMRYYSQSVRKVLDLCCTVVYYLKLVNLDSVNSTTSMVFV